MKKHRVLEHVFAILTLILTFLVIISGNFFGKKLQLQVGEIVPEVIYAPFQVENKIATERKKEQAAQSVSPVFVIDTSIEEKALYDIELLFNYVEAIQTSGINETYNTSPVTTLQNKSPILLYEDEYRTLLEMNSNELSKIEETSKEIIHSILSNGVKEDENKSSEILLALDETNLMPTYQKLVYEIVSSQIKANMLIDEETTEKQRQLAKDRVEAVYLLQGEKIVDAGSRLTEEQYQLLEQIGYLDNEDLTNYSQYFGVVIIILLLLLIFIRFVRPIHMIRSFEFKQKGLFFILYMISLIIILFMRNTEFIYVPLSITPMLIAILMRKDLAVVFHIILIMITAIVHKSDSISIMFLLISGILSILIMSHMQQRKQTTKSALIVGITTSIIYIGLELIVGVSLNTQLLLEALQTGLIGILSVIVVVGSLPLWEAAFGFITPIQLLELTNPNQPILKRLLLEATGTYYHSLLVANLAESAADDIGANPLMARVGGYYHDIGKLGGVNYYKENQVLDNPHDYLDPTKSAHIIRSHTTYGLELCEKYKLPKCIKDMVMQHHGTTTMTYFYVKAQSQDETIDEALFKYPGPKPQTKEAALIMLADVVEATVRAMQHKIGTEVSLEDLVRKMVKQKLDQGQLDECPLYISDIEKIIHAFTRLLKGMYHERIEYPERKEK